PRRLADRASREDQEHLPDAGESDRRAALRWEGADVPERGGRGWRRKGLSGVSRVVDALRQRHPRDDTAVGNQERDDDDRGARRSADQWVRGGGHCRGQRYLSNVETAGARLLPPGRRELEAGRVRTSPGDAGLRKTSATEDEVKD